MKADWRLKPNMSFKCILQWSLVVAGIVWLVLAVCGVCGQRQLFFMEGKELFCDYWMPRITAERGYSQDDGVDKSGWIDGEYKVAAVDRCYPPLAMMPMKVFPATWRGAWSWAIVAALAYFAVMCWVTKMKALPLAAVALSMPALFAVERANSIWLSAGLVAVFLAWYEDEGKWKRVAAALAISAAACMKISPALLGILYFNTKRGIAWKDILLCVAFCAVLFFVPFALMPGGFGGLRDMLGNAALNGQFGLRTSDFGIIPIWRSARIVLGQSVRAAWPGMMLVARLSQVLGLGCLVLGAVKRDKIAAVCGMLLAAGNMYYYGMLYLLPFFVVWAAKREPMTPVMVFEGIAWFVMLFAPQLFAFGHPINTVVCDIAFLALVLYRIACAGNLVRNVGKGFMQI